MLRRTHVEPFLREADGWLRVDFLRERPDGRVVAFLDRLCRLVERLEGRTRAEVREALRRQECRVRDARRLAGLGKSLLDRCEFRYPEGARRSSEVRAALFRARGERWPPTPGDRREPYRAAARELELPEDEVDRLLYADRPDRRVLARAPTLDGRDLLDRYNLDLARGVLLQATGATASARGGWSRLFRAVKLARLMYRIEPVREGREGPEGGRDGQTVPESPADGRDAPARRYRVHLTGPAVSYVTRPERYGARFARVVPALVRCPGWELEAEILRAGRRLRYSMDPSTCPFPDPSEGRAREPRFDSSFERSLAEEFREKLGPEREGWSLHREGTPVPLGEELFLPDFTVRHEDGREALVEIVGFWTPEYLEEKVGKVRAAGLKNLVLVVYRDLAAVKTSAKRKPAEALREASPGPVLWFARKPKIGEVMEAVERTAVPKK